MDSTKEAGLSELRSSLTEVAETFATEEAVEGWKLVGASFDSNEYYYDDDRPERKRPEVIRLTLTGKVDGQKVTFNSKVEAGKASITRIWTGDKEYY